MLPEAGGAAPADRTGAAPETSIAVERAGSLLWWAIALIVVADQLTKLLVQRFIPVFDAIPIIPGLLSLVHVHNAGVAFGIMNDMSHPFRSTLTTALALVALVGIVYYSRQVRREERLARLGLSLILGGAVGNLIDRARQGYVVDFVDVFWQDWHFWAFNVADAAITCGAILIFFELFFPSRHASHPV
jgi:signal peptidase II